MTGEAKNLHFTSPAITNDQFGSDVELEVGDAREELRSIAAGGQIIKAYRGFDHLDYRISRTQLDAINGSSAELYFSIFVHEVADIDSVVDYDELLFGPTLIGAQYSAVLSGGDRADPTPSLTISQSGFDSLLPEPDFTTGLGSAVSWTPGIIEGSLDLRSFGLGVDEFFAVSYNWGVKVENEYGGFSGPVSASFFDPLSGDGSFSFDANGTEIFLTGAADDPTVTPVPLPAGGTLMLTALAALGWRARRRKSENRYE